MRKTKALKKKGVSLNAYHSVTQLRADGWKRLKDNAARLAEAAASNRDPEALKQAVAEDLALLEPIDSYWAFPSPHDHHVLHELFDDGEYDKLSRACARINRALTSLSYRYKTLSITAEDEEGREEGEDFAEYSERHGQVIQHRPYFEVLVVDDISLREEETLRSGLRKMRHPEDRFMYEIVVVPSFEDALIAVLFNFNIQVCVIRYGFPFKSRHRLDMLRQLVEDFEGRVDEHLPESQYGPLLGSKIAELRPEIDLYLVSDMAVEEIAGKLCRNFRRVFYREEDYLELNLSILRGVNARYQTPFFTALKEYSKQPTGVFHALPISRGKSIIKSNWIQDMLQFYGPNIFMAETSATAGGLDSLLDPVGPIKIAQELAARAFGARQTFFVTNGTSTGNKIVVQALVEPGDVVLVDRNCHKSHHYGMVLAGAQVAYLDSYPLQGYTMYGAVPLKHIKETLLAYRRAGRLDQVKMLLLTNCTFDGIIYDVERVMEECLAIKPDLIFLWDEAWFAFAGFHPTYRRRTGMSAAARLRERYRSPEYRKRYEAFKAFVKKDPDDAEWLNTRLLPDPDHVRIRVYVTQSTHKRLTALRQGSMIHVYDQDFRHKVEESFHEAYMTHTSTSPNYQILASLDIGRRQMELEGFELVQRQTELAMALREAVTSHPLLRKYFDFLTFENLIPAEYRPSGIKFYYSPEEGWSRMEEAWRQDEFVLEPSHLSLAIGDTGIDGDTFKHDYLMDRYGIQINKTTRNTVLFMTNIGTTRSSVAYLIEVLVKIAQTLDEELEDQSPLERRLHEQRVRSLTHDNPPLPDFSRFHDFFREYPEDDTREGTLRKAFFMSYKDELCDYLRLDELRKRIAGGHDVVSAMFVIPYPPGFPVLVPGQVINEDTLAFMQALDTREIHGYRPGLGFRVFTEQALRGEQPEPAAEGVHTAPRSVIADEQDALHQAPEIK